MRRMGKDLLRRGSIAVVAVVIAAAMFAPVSLLAQDQAAQSATVQPPPTPVPPAMDGFAPMSEQAPREVLPATPLVFYAYAFVWLALVAYVFLMWRRMVRVEQDLADVQRRLKDRPQER